MVAPVVWHGTQAEAAALGTAMAHNCGCTFTYMNMRLSTCSVHQALLTDQRRLDGLVWERRLWAVHLPGAGLRVIRPRED
jgi:hypothetical protein